MRYKSKTSHATAVPESDVDKSRTKWTLGRQTEPAAAIHSGVTGFQNAVEVDFLSP